MFGIYAGRGHFPQTAWPRGRRWASPLVLFLTLGCASQQPQLADERSSLKLQGSDLLCSTALSVETPKETVAAILPPEAERPIVSRLQKPDAEPAKRTAARTSILDQATYQTPAPANGEIAAQIRAIVNGEAILDEEVRGGIFPALLATQQLPEPERTARRKEFFEKQLQQLIERELILKDMETKLHDRKAVLEKLHEAAGKEFDKKIREMRKQMNLKTDEEMKAFLRAQGLSVAGVRRQIERSFMAMEYMRNRIFPALERIGPEQIREYYDRHPEEFQASDSVTWQDIFLDVSRYGSRDTARQVADDLVRRGRAGEDFRQLVTKFDQGNSLYLNGEGFGHRRGEIRPLEAEPVLFGMREGEVGLVELTNGFHVVRLVKREFAGLKPFDEKTQTAIENKLKGVAWEREYQRIMRELKARASIEISAKP